MENIRVGTSEKVGVFISSFAYLIGAYVVAFLKVPRLAAMLVFMIPAYLVMILVGGRFIGKFTRRTSRHLAAAASVVSQSLSNITLIHALGADQRVESKVVRSLSRARRAALNKNISAATQFGFTFLVAYSANAVAFWQGSHEISRAAQEQAPNITAGAVYTVIFVLLDGKCIYFASTMATTNPSVASFVISQAAPFLQIFGAAAAASETLRSVADRTSSIDGTLTGASSSLSSRPGSIIFEGVAFSYPSRRETQALKGVSFRLAEGKLTAIVGASGSGKSTLGGLLNRLYDPCAGTILVGGKDISFFDVRKLRQRMAIVDQDPALLCCSVFENIAFGLLNANDDSTISLIGSRLFKVAKIVRKGEDLRSVLSKEPPTVHQLFDKVQQAAIMADAHSFIQSLQHGYATLIGPAGVELSGGQRQRLALARALVRDPPILILDEATSALDSASEQRIIVSLRENREDKTTITIAHRLGTVKGADHIIVMHDGCVAEEGTHDELLEKQGKYKAMTEVQSISSLVSAEPSEASTLSTMLSTETKAVRPKIKRGSLKSFRLPSWRSYSRPDGTSQDQRSRLWPTMRSFSKLARPQLLTLFLGFLGVVIAGGAYSGDAVIFGTTISRLDPCHGVSSIISAGKLAGLLFFILALTAFLANGVGGSAFGWAAENIVFKIRILTFRSLIKQDVRWYTSAGRTPALLLSYFITDTGILAGLSGVVVGTILTILVNLVASILLTHIIAWKIALVLLATIPILLGSGFMRLYALSSLQERHQKLYALPAGISLEAVASIKTIASYSLEGEFYERYRRSLRAPYKASLRGFAYTNFWLATAYSVSFLIYALAYWWGAKQIIAGTYSQTQFFIVLPALLFSAQSCGQMFALAPDVSNARLAATRLFHLIDSQTARGDLEGSLTDVMGEEAKIREDPEKALVSPPSTAPTVNQNGMAIDVRGINFAYPDRPGHPVLDNLDLSIQPNEFCALVGPSGTGKSTIFSLLESFYLPSSGTIYLDNHCITTSAPPYHRSSISLVPQGSTLFSDTVKWNIALGAHPSQTPTDDEIIHACKLANIHSFIASLPHGYDTQCGATASHFSGGQKQRLCIARALVRRPRLLLLDEPTSALDAESEASLQETIESFRGRMTVLVIAHRLSTVQRADRIFWIEGGRCTHSGTHAELLLGCPGYRESAAHQSVG
ncbi:MAG: hypothetical protein Q9181_000925 [Wetmoreana brouardii]